MADKIKIGPVEKRKKLPLGIATECVCDLPRGMVEKHNIEMIYYSIVTERGVFRDRDEITPENIYEHMENGGQKAESISPTVKEYENFFRQLLDKYEHVIHITISKGIDDSYEKAYKAKEKIGNIGDKLDIIDSMSISTGMGLLVHKACELKEEGLTPNNIYNELVVYRHKISVSFIMHDFWYFYLNDLVSLKTVKFCNLLSIRPVLAMKEGKIKLSMLLFGNFASCAKLYIKLRFLFKKNIVPDKLFFTHSGCNVKLLNSLKGEIEEQMTFKDIIVSKASATVSSNCGPSTLGVLYVKE